MRHVVLVFAQHQSKENFWYLWILFFNANGYCRYWRLNENDIYWICNDHLLIESFGNCYAEKSLLATDNLLLPIHHSFRWWRWTAEERSEGLFHTSLDEFHLTIQSARSKFAIPIFHTDFEVLQVSSERFCENPPSGDFGGYFGSFLKNGKFPNSVTCIDYICISFGSSW